MGVDCQMLEFFRVGILRSRASRGKYYDDDADKSRTDKNLRVVMGQI